MTHHHDTVWEKHFGGYVHITIVLRGSIHPGDTEQTLYLHTYLIDQTKFCTIYTHLTTVLVYNHRWTRLLKQQLSNTGTVYSLLTKENKLLFLFLFWSKPDSIFYFRWQQTNGSLLFPISVYNKQTEVAIYC